MDKNINLDQLTLGVCYYPEHWEEDLWASDLERMLANGIQVIRIAEFAWNKFEPVEGQFTFEFFDRFMNVVSQTSMKVIFCTPTATPPAWASHDYPEILNGLKDGTLFRHGHRRHYNYNSPKYQELTRIIVAKIAEHYGQHPSIVGWQVDNEINCEINEFYAESDSIAFRKFLQDKYQTLDHLNQTWGTVFWNQDYTAWEQVFVPRPTPSGETNPHQQLDYLRFVSDSAFRFTQLQSEILRQYIAKGVYITTNGLFGNVDNHKQTRENLDFMMYDSYPNFAYCLSEDPRNSTNLNDRKWSRNLTEVRSISSNFGIMEQQSGSNGWTHRMEAPSPRPGQMTLWTLQSVAHGADYVSYFRWRTCTVGTEIYWHGILDYDNRDNRRLQEVGEINKIFQAIGSVAGSRYQATFAVIKEYDNVWDAQYDVWHQRVESESGNGWFKASQLTHTPMDYLYLVDDTTLVDLQRYSLLVYPHATILSERTTKMLQEYVAAGGKLVMGCRTGYKDPTGRCVMIPKPGLVAELFGADVRDFTFVGPNDDPSTFTWEGRQIDAPVFNDILAPIGSSEILATYDTNYYAGQPALIKNIFGRGETYYFGGAFNEKTAQAFLEYFGIANPYHDILDLPEDCELAVREKDGIHYAFVLNYAHQMQKIHLKRPLKNLYDNQEKVGEIGIKPYETMVFMF